MEKQERKQIIIMRMLVGNLCDIGNNEVYRQLPVGLFENEVSKETMIFTGGKSAIDIWTWNNEEAYLVELKTLNPMVGIITEIFFYANYMRDLLSKDGLFTLNKAKRNKDRGYSEILRNDFKKVNGMMLADKYHPLITDKTIDVLNAGKNEEIHYIKATYSYDLKLTGI